MAAPTAAPAGAADPDRVNLRGLEDHLHRHVEGEVRFDSASRALYATDASNFRQVPLGVVVPRTLADVVATTVACHRYRAPLLSRGGGTSLSGETVNRAVVVDFSKYLNTAEEPDSERRTVVAQSGVINEQLNRRVGRAGLVFGPDPSSHSRCTIGGNVGNNSCGVHSVQAANYGPGPRTSDNVEALEVLTYAGDRFWVGVGEEDELDAIIAAGGAKGRIYGQLRDLRDRYAAEIRAGFRPVAEVPRRVSGYNLDELLPENGFNVARALVGTEGTCATVLRAELKLTPAMLARTTVVVAYDSLAEAGDDIEDIRAWKPIGLEALDDQLVGAQRAGGMNPGGLRELPRGQRAGAWLLVQFGSGEAAESERRAGEFREHLLGRGMAEDRIAVLPGGQEGGSSGEVWRVREGGLGATAFPPGEPDHWPGWEDSAVPPAKVGGYVRDLRELYDRYGLRGAMYGHLGEGCIHSRIDFDLETADGIARYRAFLEEAADLVVSYGGSLSGEHGDGQQRAELLVKQYGRDLVRAMGEFKEIWDPDGGLNPGKVVSPRALDEDLRLGADYRPDSPPVRFAYRDDEGDFAHAALRCVGVGECRVPDATQTMCPSYQVTREEMHSTRGRARLLFEMLQGEVITDGWQSREVAEALDLCLSCKGCTNDCPVDVDMPTYKAEFRSRHYRSWRRWRPRSAYAFGFIDQAARIATALPRLANLATHAPGLRRIAKFAAGIDQRRDLPAFAPVSLQQWFAERGTVNPDGPRVVLLPDTFNNRLNTAVGVACVEALEGAGWQVVMPAGHVCCGRPLYDFGFLDMAERYLDNLLERLRPEIRAGTPVVGMEPSCLAVLKDELPNLKPRDQDALRLAHGARHFAEFLQEHDVRVPRLEGRALLWGHCHQRATGGIGADRDVLERMGLEVEPIVGGCCGLAGSWGFENGRYDLSMACGEEALFPALREAGEGDFVVANGFSCSTQLEHAGQGLPRFHLGQLIAAARADGTLGSVPEQPRRSGRSVSSRLRRRA